MEAGIRVAELLIYSCRKSMNSKIGVNGDGDAEVFVMCSLSS